MGAVHLLPGSTSSNTVERGDYDSEATAVMTMAELETWLVHQIAGVYHHTVHRAFGKAPITVWTEAMAEAGRPLRTAPDEDRFYLDFLPFRKRTVQRGGVAMFNINYSDGVLSVKSLPTATPRGRNWKRKPPSGGQYCVRLYNGNSDLEVALAGTPYA